MKRGYLSQYFEAVAAKRLSAVEVDIKASNQHEFNGTKELKQVLGEGTGEKITFPTVFLWLGSENEGVSNEGFVTWYDARRAHPVRSEYRLYFPTTDVSRLARENDMLFIAKRTDGTIMIIITASGSTIENQLFWLFDFPKVIGTLFEFSSIDNKKDLEVDFTVRFILDELGIEIEEMEADRLDALVEKFNGVLPSTSEFSQFSRDTIKDINSLDDPDGALMAWMDQEEKLFRRIERQLVSKRLNDGFATDGATDVDGFISFSLQVQNRRKARAGFALENHLEEIFKNHSLKFTRGGVTENKSKPDFIFPDIKLYHQSTFPDGGLTMLGAKTSCKDRWRQVLSEAERIKDKHLLTMEPGISENQTSEMRNNRLQLVLPRALHSTYNDSQRSWIINLEAFIGLAKRKQIDIFGD